jgi:hypothetical protein
MIEGGLEELQPSGVFVGWLRDTAAREPVVLHIRSRGQTVAATAARAFRPDLLAAGHGHGHYGFAARSRAALPPGAADFELFLPPGDEVIHVLLTVPRLEPPRAASVGDLVRGETTWTVADLMQAPACLGLAAQHAAMGTARFVDVTYRFVLRRGPAPAEAQVFTVALDEERLSPDGFLLELLGGRERADLGDALASPWDPSFPYTLGGEMLPKPARRGGAAARRQRVRA